MTDAKPAPSLLQWGADLFFKSNGEVKKRSFFNLILCVIIFIIIFTGLLIYLYKKNLGHLGISADPQHWGQMGDFFGGILNPFLAFFSFFMLSMTLIIQSFQNKQLAHFNQIQKFETVFFKLIDLHRENLQLVSIQSSVTVPAAPHPRKGRDGIDSILTEASIAISLELLEENDMRSAFHEGYAKLYQRSEFRSELAHYLRNLYHLFKYVDGSETLTLTEKEHYAKLARAQLSSNETAVLFLNGQSTWGRNFKLYIEEYALLQDLDASDLRIEGLTDDEFRSFYDARAYGDEVAEDIEKSVKTSNKKQRPESAPAKQ